MVHTVMQEAKQAVQEASLGVQRTTDSSNIKIKHVIGGSRDRQPRSSAELHRHAGTGLRRPKLGLS